MDFISGKGLSVHHSSYRQGYLCNIAVLSITDRSWNELKVQYFSMKMILRELDKSQPSWRVFADLLSIYLFLYASQFGKIAFH